MHITTEDVIVQILKLSNWNVVGSDSIQDYMMKCFSSIHKGNAFQLSNCLKSDTVPERMVEEKTELLIKEWSKSNRNCNY